MVKIYGIKNCNSMKKAFDFLLAQKIEYEFIDFKKQQISKDFIEKIIKLAGIESLVNTKGTTFKKLKESGINSLNDITPEIIAANPTLIKRPLIITFSPNGDIKSALVGLSEIKKLAK